MTGCATETQTRTLAATNARVLGSVTADRRTRLQNDLLTITGLDPLEKATDRTVVLTVQKNDVDIEFGLAVFDSHAVSDHMVIVVERLREAGRLPPRRQFDEDVVKVLGGVGEVNRVGSIGRIKDMPLVRPENSEGTHRKFTAAGNPARNFHAEFGDQWPIRIRPLGSVRELNFAGGGNRILNFVFEVFLASDFILVPFFHPSLESFEAGIGNRDLTL